MPRTDVEIIDSVSEEWGNGVGHGITVRAVLWLIDALRDHFGRRTNVKGVVEALWKLSYFANSFRGSLRAEYLKEHPDKRFSLGEENRLVSYMFRHLSNTLDYFQSHEWWQRDVPLSVQRSLAGMSERFSRASDINSIDDLSSACHELKKSVHELGLALSNAPNRYTELCVQWMCFQAANAIPESIFQLAADETAKAEVRLLALEQAQEWMQKIVENCGIEY